MTCGKKHKNVRAWCFLTRYFLQNICMNFPVNLDMWGCIMLSKVVVSKICYFHPDPWGRFPFWLIFFRWVETTNQLGIDWVFAWYNTWEEKNPNRLRTLQRVHETSGFDTLFSGWVLPAGGGPIETLTLYINPKEHITGCFKLHLHPKKLTWNLEMMVSNRNLLFQGSIFRFHVCFGGWYIWFMWVGCF